MNQAILDALGQCPFSSIQELDHLTCISTTTVHRHLTQSFGFMVKHLRWVPHTLTPTQETECAILSLEVLRQLRSIEHHGWQFIIPLDESGSLFLQTMSRSGFASKNKPLKNRGIPSKTQK
jgi:hypothetical protein